MSSPCLSSVLTHANLTVYQTGLMDMPQPSTPPGCSRTSAASYRLSSPPCWSEDQVLEWLSDHVESSRLDASTLSLSLCAVDGPTLCQMKAEEMVAGFGPQLGPQLHQSLQDLRSRHEVQSLSGPELNETCQLLDTFLDNLSFPLLSTIRIGAVEESVSRRDFDLQDDYDLPSMTLEPLAPEYLSDGDDRSSFNDSGSNESDPELSCQFISKLQIKVEQEQTPVKRPRGRPPKVIQQRGSIFSSPKKTKHAPRGTHLWEFIRDILIHPEKNQGLMKWEDRHEGVFKFLKSEAVAQMWGQKKRNSSMTYEKLSRAMRYYYKRDILERVDGRRLVYKFGKNSSGWKIEEIGLHL